MSFSCPNFDPATDRCDRVQDRCVCGRPGCVLARNSTFAIPAALRLADPAALPPGMVEFPHSEPDDQSASRRASASLR